jgi:hypothetical protein
MLAIPETAAAMISAADDAPPSPRRYAPQVNVGRVRAGNKSCVGSEIRSAPVSADRNLSPRFFAPSSDNPMLLVQESVGGTTAHAYRCRHLH